MRVLMWFTIGFTIACIISVLFGAFWIAGLITAVLAAMLFFLRYRPARVAALILVGLSVGVFWNVGYNHLYLDNARAYDGMTIETAATVSDYSYPTDYGVAADGKIRLNEKEFSIRLYINAYQELKPGDRVEGRIRLRLTTKDSLQGETYHQGDGIFLLGYVQEDATITLAETIPSRFWAARLRRDIQILLEKTFPEDVLAFANALLLGDSSQLDYKTDTDFKLSGIRHIIAVSGLHVSILLSVVFILCGKNRFFSAIIGIPLLILFAAVVGFTPSVMRACIMQILMLVGMFLNREYDPPTSVSFAVLVMLVINPVTIVSVSFQLSAGCVIGILLLFERVNRRILCLLRAPTGRGFRASVSRWISSSVSITISTFVTTTPLSAMYFGSISIVGVLTNLLTLWVVSFIFCGIIAAIIAGLVWMSLAKGIAWIVAFPMRYVMLVASLLAEVPMSAVYTKSVYIVLWLVASYCLFGIFLFFRRRYPVLLTGCVAVLLALAVCASWLEPKLDHFRISVFDVGQGQSILVQYEGKYYLVDCGGDSNRVAADTVSQHLLSAGITRLNGLIVTHYDDDHAGGISNLLSRIPADILYLPDVPDDSGSRELLSQSKAQIHWVQKLERFRISNMEIGMIPGEHPTEDNERSMCVLFNIEDYDILISGDRSAAGEHILLKKMNIPEVDVLVVGHHGSGTATSLELLEAVKPDVAVISVGKDNHYGHPSDEVLYRLRLFGCKIRRTDLEGTIVFRG